MEALLVVGAAIVGSATLVGLALIIDRQDRDYGFTRRARWLALAALAAAAACVGLSFA